MIYIYLFLFGSMVGSFLNVCVYRMPREEKIGMSRSRCPHCKKIICWYDNIPFLSYILLTGKCRHCKKPISFRYFVIEFLTACMLCLLWYMFGNIVLVTIYFIFICLLIIGSFIDLEYLIIPDATNLSGIIVGLLASTLYPALMGEHIWWHGLLKSLAGALAGGGSLFLIAVTAGAILKKEAMGMGDVKLLAMIGSFIGWKWALFTIFTSSLLGSAAGGILMLFSKVSFKGKIPFGPYLAVGSIVSLFWGKAILGWYGRLFW